MRSRRRRLLVLAVAIAVVPPAAQAAESAADPPLPEPADRSRPAQPPRPAERPMAERVPHFKALSCIAKHESGGRWDISTGNGYYGGLQMDRDFQRTYAPRLYARKGTADNWSPEEQMRAAGRAVGTRGFAPWPTTARICGLL